MSAVDTQRVPVEGGEAVFCEVTGHGPPLVLTHDAFLHRESWDAQFEPFLPGGALGPAGLRAVGRAARALRQ